MKRTGSPQTAARTTGVLFELGADDSESEDAPSIEDRYESTVEDV